MGKVQFEAVITGITNLNTRKAIQKTDIPVKNFEKTLTFLKPIPVRFFNESIGTSQFPSISKQTNTTLY